MIKVSICCVTYNHEKYLRQCLEGFVNQKVNFEYEILVHEDASTDKTAQVLREYERKYPHLFRCVYQTENQFNIRNSLTEILFPMAKGKFIALCEGDDYWVDEYKLQKQVDFLEANPDYAIHSGLIRRYEQKINKFIEYDYPPESYFIEDFYFKNNLYTCTIMFRNLLKDYKFPKKIFMGDWMLYTMILEKTKLKAFRSSEVFSVYRNHSLGITKSINNKQYRKLRIIQIEENEKLVKGFDDKKIVKYKNLRWYYIDQIKLALELRQYLKVVKLIFLKFRFKTLRVIVKSYFQG